MSKKQIVVKTYRNDKEFQRDANKMKARGYRINNTSQSERSGCFKWLLVGPLALVWKKHEITVIYELL